MEHRSGSEAHEDGRQKQKPVRFRHRRRTSPCACCHLDAGYLRELELKLHRMERIAETNRRQALTDPLTGLPNRRHLELYLDRVLGHATLRPSSLAVFDVDDFKCFNDRHGYVAGDRAMAAIGTVLSGACANPSAHPEPHDSSALSNSGHGPFDRLVPTGRRFFAARLGGDEFVVVFVAEKAARARRAADRMARSVARHPLLSSRRVTVSFGFAALDVGMRRWQDLLAAADRDLRRRRLAARTLPADRGFRYLWAHPHGSRRPSRPARDTDSPPRPAPPAP